MKRRKNLSLSPRAILRGEQIAAEQGKSLSGVIEEQWLAIPTVEGEEEDYWAGPALKPVVRHGDKRADYLKRKRG